MPEPTSTKTWPMTGPTRQQGPIPQLATIGVQYRTLPNAPRSDHGGGNGKGGSGANAVAADCGVTTGAIARTGGGAPGSGAG